MLLDKKSIPNLGFPLVLIFSIFFLSNSFSQTNDPPKPYAWIQKVKMDEGKEISRYNIKSGMYFALIDYQQNFKEEVEFNHYAIKIVSFSGVENASKIQVTYDTSYQSFHFHYAFIRRNGKLIDRTNEVSFEIIKNETQLKSNIYSGTVTSLAVLNDIRKDDILEYAYSLKGDNPVYEGAKFGWVPLQDINYSDKISLKYLYPQDEQFFYNCVGCNEEEVVVETLDDLRVISIERNEAQPMKYDPQMPSWYIPFDYFIISSTNEWSEVVNWGLNVFPREEPFNFAEVEEEVFNGNESTEEKIDKLINFVQDDIRYMGIESGIGSIKPFPPQQVLSQRFGDCKDKSLLLVSLLNAIGVSKAYPALVSSTLYNTIDELIPSGQLFDHCIAYFEYKGKNYWVDPTISSQGGDFKNLVTHDYENALVLRPGESELTEMSIANDFSRSEILEEFDISNFEDTSRLSVTNTFYGANADYMRNLIEYFSPEDLSKSYKQIYANLYPGIVQQGQIDIRDDMKKNEMTIVEEYLLFDVWDGNNESYPNNWVFYYRPTTIYDHLSVQSCEARDFPTYFAHPNNIKQTASFVLPNTLQIEELNRREQNETFSFTMSESTPDPLQLLLKYEFKSLKNHITSLEYPELCKKMDGLRGNIPTVLYYPRNTNKFLNKKKTKNSITIRLKEKALSTKNDYFYIDSVIDNRSKKDEYIGFLSVDLFSNVNTFIIKGGLINELNRIVTSNSKLDTAAIPVKLYINKFHITENSSLLESSGKSSFIFDYTVEYTDASGKTKVYNYAKELEKNSMNARAHHEKHIRKSFEQLIKTMKPEIFQPKEVSGTH
jgi:hypothetical protein